MSNKRFIREIAFNADQYSKEKEYWKDRLSGELVRGSFPYDFNKMEGLSGDEATRRLERMEFNISGELFDKLIWIINDSDTRLYMILVTALVILLGKYTDREDIIVGSPIERQEIEGNFLNTILAVRMRFAFGITFKDLLMQARQTLIEAGENQNFPLEQMPYELNMDVRENDAFALFDTAILLENIHEKSYIDHIPLNMLFSFSRTHESINGAVEYNTALYKEETVRRITGHFVHLLREALANVDTPVLNLEIMPESEKEFLLVKMNDTQSEYPETAVQRLFEGRVEKKPGDIAVEEADTGRTLTYRELNRRANQLAGLLMERNVTKGTIAAVMGERTGDIVTSFLAILKVGGIFLPLDAQNPDDRLNFILEDSAARVFISQEQIIKERESLFNGFSPRNIIAMDEKSCYKGEPANPRIDTRPRDPAYIIYTSGTTGKPKGVMVEHRSLTNYIHFANRSYNGGEAVNFPFYTSIAFDLTITSIFTPLVSGNAVVVYSGWAKGNLIERIVDDKKAGVVKLTPSHLTLIGEKTITGSSCTVKRFVVGGEALKYEIARKIFDNFNGNVEIYNEYGPTEATVGCMLYKFDPIKDVNKGNSVSIGSPSANAQIYLLNKKKTPVPTGAMGEIYIGGDGLARGYLNRPELTAERFTSILLSPSTFPTLLYRTGDLARRHSDGNIEFLGRIDHQVKLRGFRIELGEIESQVLKHEAVKEAVVTIKEAAGGNVYGYQTGGSHICAYFVSEKKLSASGLREYLVEKLPEYMVPSYFVPLDAVPLTPNGKVDTRALPEPGIKAEVEYVAPGSKIEKKLVEIWSEILGLDTGIIGIHSNFFDLGGHSLSGTVLAAKIHKALEVKLTLPDLFRLPTLKELANHLEKSKKTQFTPIEPVEEKEYYPMSSAQARFFLIQQIDPEATGYNVPMAYEIEGELHTEKLRNVFRELIRRHAIFRTSFLLMDDKPVQRVREAETVEFEIEQFGVLNDTGTRSVMKDFIRPFDLSRAPLLRVGLIHTDHSNSRFILMINIHHIITDGVSMDILIKEFNVLFSGLQLPSPELHYKDFSEWQNSEKRKEEMKDLESYWLKRFEGEIPVLELPTDFPRPLIRNSQGDRISFRLDEREVSGLKELAAAQGATLFMVVLSLYNVFLSKLAGREDVIVGSPIAGRLHSDLENIIGLFINTLALWNYPEGEKSFLKFLKEVKISTLEAYENQEYQYENLVAQVSRGRDAGRNPLTDVLFALNNVDTNFLDIPKVKIPGLKITPRRSEFLSSKVDILLNAFESSGKIHFLLEYSTSLFKKETIQRFIRYFKQVVTGVLASPLQKIAGIEILSREEKEQILFDFNDTASDSPPAGTIRQLFEEQVEKRPDHIAVTAPSAGSIDGSDLQISYGELNRRSNRIAALLPTEGVVPGTIVGITAEPSLETIIGIFGILKCAGAYLPIDPGSSQDHIDYIMNDSGAVLLLNDDLTGNAPGRTQPAPPVRPHHPVCVFYGSGTTGKPVGTLIENRNLVYYVDWFAGKAAISSDDRTLLTSGLETALGNTTIYPPLLRGSKLHLVPGRANLSVERLQQCIRKYRMTYIKVTPSLFGAMVENPGFTFENIRTLRMVVETAVGCIARFIDFKTLDLNKKGTTIGYPIENMRALVLDKGRNLVPIGVIGDLFITGAGVAGGYLNRPQLTADTFNMFYRSHKSYGSYIFYKTGDLARWCPDGSIEYLGSAAHRDLPGPLAEEDGYSAPPEGEVEEKLAETWAEVLGLEKEIIDADVNFFQLGGHSLNAIILVPKIHKLFDVKVPLAEFFKNPTIKGLAAYIKGAEKRRFSAIEATEKKEYYPGSLNQNRFYILQHMYPENISYNNLQLYMLEGHPEKDRLEKAFNGLIKRHESLRTSFELIDGELVQRVHDEADLFMEFLKGSEENVKQIVTDFSKPFTLDKAPLLRVGLIRIEETRHLLIVDMHHIITDGLSFVIFSREFIELYEGIAPPPLLLQYRDFSQWQGSEHRRIKKQGEFWEKQFEDGVPVLRLRTDYPRPPVQQFEGGRINFTINAENTASIEKMARQEESSVFMVLFSVYNILLWNVTGQEDIIIGTGVLNRGHTDLMNIIGLFFNTIPIRNRIVGETGFKEFLGSVKEKMSEAFENQEYPIDVLVEDLLSQGLLDRDAGRNPLFDTMFALQNFKDIEGTAPKTGLTGLSVKPYKREKKTSRLDLFFAGTQGADSIFMTAEYSTALFAPPTIRKMTGYYVEILEQVLADKEIKLEDITLSSNLLEVKTTTDQNEYTAFGF